MLSFAIKQVKKIFTVRFIEITDSHLYYSEYFFTKTLRETRFQLLKLDYKNIDKDNIKYLLFINIKTNEELLLENLRQENQDVIIHRIEEFKRELE